MGRFRINLLIGCSLLFIASLFLLQSCKLSAKSGNDSTKFENAEGEEMEAQLLVYFKDADHSLHMALSKDGYTFTDINGGEPIVSGDTIAEQKGIRDPHISRGPDGAFYITMTDLHLFAKDLGYRNTTWQRSGDEYGWGNNRGFVLMKSYDLVNWTHSNFIFNDSFEDLKDMGCAWAPQSIYDPEEGKMMVYFTMRKGNGQTKMYYAYANDDFTELITSPKLLFDYPKEDIQVLDADITRMPDGRYCMMYVAQENPVGIKMAFSDHINRDYEYNLEWIDKEPGACEAPNVWKRINSDKWVVMYDIYSVEPHNFGFLETTDFKNFKDLGHFNKGKMKTTNFTSPKHGAVIPLTAKETKVLADHWGFDWK